MRLIPWLLVILERLVCRSMHFVISGSSGPSGSPWSILFPYFYHISWAIAQRFQVFSCVWERSSVGCSGCTVQSAKMSNSWQNICLASFSQITSSLGFRCLPSAWRHMVTNSSASREADSMAFGHSSMSNLSFYALCGLNSSRTSSSLWLVFIFSHISWAKVHGTLTFLGV